MQNVSLSIPHFKQEQDYSCVAACIRMVLEYYGINAQEDEIRRLLDTKSTGTRFINVARTVPKWELNLELGAFDFQQLKALITSKVAPIIFLMTGPLDYWDGSNEPHAVVFTGVDVKALTVKINDPFSIEPQQISIGIFKEAWLLTGNLTAALRQRKIVS
jgi:ABC-type bacteriocin/lantibiotic exporter with double-glycine peptidase domain